MSLVSKYPSEFHFLPASQLGEYFEAAWEKSSSRFAKIEVAPVFIEDGDESFELFAQGRFVEARQLVAQRVLQQEDAFSDFMQRGGTILRVRVVGRPLTSYISDYERVVYETTSTIGEKTVIVDESSMNDEEQAVTSDLLCFDRREVMVHVYTPWGRLLGIQWSRTPEVVAHVIALVDALEAKGVPAEQWPWPSRQ